VLSNKERNFFDDEISPKLKHTKRGAVALANAGAENTNLSQFYITLGDGLDYLDGKHTIFGQVAEGDEALDAMNSAFCDDKNRPWKNIR
jgi:peptidyl-prolyl cis-trans isomerase-like 4